MRCRRSRRVERTPTLTEAAGSIGGKRGSRFQRMASLRRADDLEHAQPVLNPFAYGAERTQALLVRARLRARVVETPVDAPRVAREDRARLVRPIADGDDVI